MEINYLHFDSLDSTNLWSKQHYPDFDQTKVTLVSASQQLAGYGRFKRQWISPKDENIYATFTFFRPLPIDAGQIAQVLALSALKTLKLYGLKAELKWPNDLLVDSKKIAGILCETIAMDQQMVIVIGIGININMPKETLETINQPATSLFSECGKKYPIANVLNDLQKTFREDLDLYFAKGYQPFHKEYVAHLKHKKGDLIRMGEKTGSFLQIDSTGALMTTENGKEIRHISGEII
jgi:BirA family biotin operon repressor/biotin-[acetyl-CoA-carboxylase] ligase